MLGHYLAVAAGGAVGAVLRYQAGMWLAPVGGGTFPVATLCVNLMGSGLIGAFVVLIGGWDVHGYARGLLITGMLGALTTFSTFSLDLFVLLKSGEWLRAVVYLLANVLGCLAAVAAGYNFAKWLFN